MLWLWLISPPNPSAKPYSFFVLHYCSLPLAYVELTSHFPRGIWRASFVVPFHSAKADRHSLSLLLFVFLGLVQIFCNSLVAHFSRLHAESLQDITHFPLCNCNLFPFFFCVRGLNWWGGGLEEGKGTLRNKRDGLIKSGFVFTHRKSCGCKSVTELNDLSQSPKTREQRASASSGTLSDFYPDSAVTEQCACKQLTWRTCVLLSCLPVLTRKMSLCSLWVISCTMTSNCKYIERGGM